MKYEATIKTESKEVLDFLINKAAETFSKHGATISWNKEAGKVVNKELTEEVTKEDFEELIETELKEKYVELNGYKKLIGIKIQPDEIQSTSDVMFFTHEQAKEFMENNVVFWMDKEKDDETAHDDLDELVSDIEDDLEGTAPTFKKFKETQTKSKDKKK